MIKDITIGQYYRSDSILHRLDPRVKLVGTLIFVITLFFSKSPLTYAASLLFLALMIGLSTVPLSFIVRGLKAVGVILLFSVVINIFFIPGEAIVHFGVIRITKE